MLANNVVDDPKENYQIGLWGFGFIYFYADEGGGGEGRCVLSEYNYLLMLMNLWPGDWDNQSEMMNMRVDEDNMRAIGTEKGRIRKFQRLSSNEY